MPSNLRPAPRIPDHDVLRKIGGGAYGEVWLARGVTGAMRAVKVVWREDFDDERGFEREFEGILKFEPISRDHPALVNILHVGRSTEGEQPFYYYVMELGDDVHTGREINPVEYEPRTLRGDHHQGVGLQWPLEDCLDIGLRLAEALQHLHENGLAHRDVKPSNVIFVNGRAKLADIGLVAARGQRTFVGTEGFVPPEGPGSTQADIYSLGKVLYEIATGMDRMNFPELPDDMPAAADRKRWLELNRIICEVCEPRISRRKIVTAAVLADALKSLQRGKRRRRQTGLSLVFSSLLILGVAGWAGWQYAKQTEWVKNLKPQPVVPVPVQAMLRVFSAPEGADVYDEGGKLIGTTPTQQIDVTVGQKVSYTLRKDGYRPLQIEGLVEMSAVKEPMILYGEMQVFSPPVVGESWVDHRDNVYQPVDDSHVSSSFVAKRLWQEALKPARLEKVPAAFVKITENGVPVEVVLTDAQGAEKFCTWLRSTGIESGYLTDKHELSPLPELVFNDPAVPEAARTQKLVPFRLKVRKILYGQVYVTTDPPGAELFLNGQSVGMTHGELLVPDVKPGALNLLVVLEGYKPMSKKYQLGEGAMLEVHLTLTKNQGVVFGRPWQNELGMKFVPVGKDLMAAVWETRVKDYAVFVKEGRHAEPKHPAFKQEETHPVVNVSRSDAIAFCEWLTKRERSRERISQNHRYRLPTDMEWSQMVGLNDEDGTASPGYRDSRKKEVFPWGASWAEGNVPGNFADQSAGLTPGVDVNRTILGYNDGYAFTSPVGSFPANDLGIFDLSGNAQEWVSDAYSSLGNSRLGVLRGGGWNTYQLENLYSGSRNAVPPDYADVMYGFRVVLAKEATPTGN